MLSNLFCMSTAELIRNAKALNDEIARRAGGGSDGYLDAALQNAKRVFSTALEDATMPPLEVNWFRTSRGTLIGRCGGAYYSVDRHGAAPCGVSETNLLPVEGELPKEAAFLGAELAKLGWRATW